MRRRMNKTTIGLLLLMFSIESFAHEYSCSNNGATRKISVEHEPGRELPCQVKYEKPDEGEVSYPWNARNSPDYCKQKADYLAQRLRSFGWTCEQHDEPPAQ